MAYAEDLANGFIEDAILSSPADNVRVWFDDSGIGTEAAYLNSANNIILRATVEKFKDGFDNWDMSFYEPSQYGISLLVQFMNNTPDQEKDQQFQGQLYSFMNSVVFASCLVMALGIATATVVAITIEEKVTKSKHLQFISGVKPITYWFSSFCWDYLLYWILIPVLVGLLVLVGEKTLTSSEYLPAFLALIAAFG